MFLDVARRSSCRRYDGKVNRHEKGTPKNPSGCLFCCGPSPIFGNSFRFSFIMQRLTPLALLWATASLASQASRNLAKDRTEELAVIFEKFAREKLAKGACDMIIFGHCHKPVVLEYPFGDKVKTAAIPGAWINHRSYLYFADGVLSLRYFEG